MLGFIDNGCELGVTPHLMCKALSCSIIFCVPSQLGYVFLHILVRGDTSQVYANLYCSSLGLYSVVIMLFREQVSWEL